MAGSSIRWRALNQPGNDACTLRTSTGGARLDGHATWHDPAGAASLRYAVTCDRGWVTASGRVEGSLADRPVSFEIARTDAGLWTLNGASVGAVQGSVDLDLAFTPATNLLAIRRLNLAVGQAADAPAAWLDVRAGSLSVLPQRYQRRSETTYWYQAPTVGYAALLQVDPTGFVLSYPGLWQADLPGS